MRRFALLAAAAAVVLVGCKSRESQVIGTWTGGGMTMTFKENKSVTTSAGMVNMEGNWSYANDKVSVTTKTINGQSAEQFAKQLQEQMKSNPLFAGMADKLGDLPKQMAKPSELTLSEDAKTLTAKNPMSGAELKLTKSES